MPLASGAKVFTRKATPMAPMTGARVTHAPQGEDIGVVVEGKNAEEHQVVEGGDHGAEDHGAET